jgi:hypothetical protein
MLSVAASGIAAVDTSELLEMVEARLQEMSEGQRHEAVAAILDAIEPPVRPHYSDCARNSTPAYMPQPCDCGAVG